MIRAITVDGVGAKKASDVVAYVLGCGHTVGGEEYQTFIDGRKEILTVVEAKKRAIDTEARGKIALLWKTLVNKETS